LGDRGSWAEALGAWRQPTVLLIPAAAAASGVAAAYHALLKLQGVPLLGLIQGAAPGCLAIAAAMACPGWAGWRLPGSGPALAPRFWLRVPRIPGWWALGSNP
jgi:hypothetical protein